MKFNQLGLDNELENKYLKKRLRYISRCWWLKSYIIYFIYALTTMKIVRSIYKSKTIHVLYLYDNGVQKYIWMDSPSDFVDSCIANSPSDLVDSCIAGSSDLSGDLRNLKIFSKSFSCWRKQLFMDCRLKIFYFAFQIMYDCIYIFFDDVKVKQIFSYLTWKVLHFAIHVVLLLILCVGSFIY